MSAPNEIIELIGRFERNLVAYKSGQYNETQLRREFLDPFFETLGWDVNNKQGYAEAYKDVIHEDAIKIGSATKAPDYCFRIGGTRKFFVEAKKPSVNLRDDVSPAFQLRRYAWSAKLPLSILTDFEEFLVYDCRIKPDKTDKPSTSRVLYLNYAEYPQRWDEIASIFSRDAILKGSFDKYAESTKLKKGTAELLVLAQLDDAPRHGYEIARRIETRSGGVVSFNVASLYPVLYRLERRGLIAGRWVEKAGQRRRRYYRLTDSGRKMLTAQRESWGTFTTAIGRAAGLRYA